MRKQVPYSVPDGYFDSLRTRLSEIPQKRARVNFLPYLALAASFLVLLAVGHFVLQRTASSYRADDNEIIEYIIESGTTLAQLENIVDY